ncbi:serine hydrolase domain-containing protein [Streptomyces sp. MP131-18]|uniref:serine hydrolase domain-containing protein n=1 Tax=Streptomyces sp. MP131-18 TaxID=1857892 RepID=UPI00097C6005|nr:serine hydrolase domain-containing protein [Streptomyces sp. MP131-18]ONK09921.1 D-alanyl-D-alanine carboxypeptidase precursor [Streptomyces sp. MP131-18]
MDTPSQHHRRRAVVGAGLAALATAPVSLTAASAASAATTATTAQAAPAAAGTDALRREVERAQADGSFVSLVAHLRDGRHRARARSGVADLVTGEPAPYDGYVRGNSVTKTFVATLVLLLEAEGRLSLGDPVSHWLPGLISGNGYDGDAITLRNLLQNTSGLPNHTQLIDFDQTGEAFRRHRERHYEPVELVAMALAEPPSFPPADPDDPEPDFEYSNTNFVVAGMVVEAVTGRGWRRELHRRIARPLGLRRTYAPADDTALPAPHARTYKRFPENRAEWTDTTMRNMTFYGASAEIITSPGDLDRFTTALFRGELLPPPQLRAMLRSVPLAGEMAQMLPEGRYGLGMVRRTLPCGSHVWTPAGQGAGSQTYLSCTEDGRTAVVVHHTGTGGPEQITRGVTATMRLMDNVLCDAIA